MALVSCPECGKQISTSAQFCPECGCKIAICPDCENAVVADSECCPTCGHVFKIEKAPSESPTETKENPDKTLDKWIEESPVFGFLADRGLSLLYKIASLLCVASFVGFFILMDVWSDNVNETKTEVLNFWLHNIWSGNGDTNAAMHVWMEANMIGYIDDFESKRSLFKLFACLAAVFFAIDNGAFGHHGVITLSMTRWIKTNNVDCTEEIIICAKSMTYENVEESKSKRSNRNRLMVAAYASKNKTAEGLLWLNILSLVVFKLLGTVLLCMFLSDLVDTFMIIKVTEKDLSYDFTMLIAAGVILVIHFIVTLVFDSVIEKKAAKHFFPEKSLKTKENV